MQTCTAQTKNGLPCKMRPPRGATLCRNHATAAVDVGAGEIATQDLTTTSSSTSTSSAGGLELVGGVLAGLALVAVAAWALLSSTSAPNPTPAS